MKTNKLQQTPSGGSDERIVRLLPCPFCGETPRLTQIGNAHTPKRGIKIKCPTLGCVEFRTCVIRNTIEWAEERSLEKWNTRISLPNVEATHGGTPLSLPVCSPSLYSDVRMPVIDNNL